MVSTNQTDVLAESHMRFIDQNRELLTGILRDEWGFEGIVVSDFQYGMRDAALSVEAGLDVEMPFRMIRAQHLRGEIESFEFRKIFPNAFTPGHLKKK